MKSLLSFSLAVSVLIPALQLGVFAADYNSDVKVIELMKPTTVNSVGQPIAYPKDAPAEAAIREIDIPVGKETGWHRHPVPLFGYVASGTLTIHFGDGTKKVMHQGEAFAEAVNLLHNGRNEGTEPVKLIVFFAGEKGKPYTVKAPLDKDGQPVKDPAK